MNDVHKGLVTLIRSAITGEKLPLPQMFSLESAYPLIKSHQIANLVYEGAIHCGVDRVQPVMQEMFQNAYQCLIYSAKQMKALEKLYAAFCEAQIDYMPLKGCNLKKLYPKSELRIMGDADILIRVEQYDRIVPIMERLGYRFIKESSHEIVWDHPDIHLELHKCIVADHHDVASGYYGDGWGFANKQENTRYAMKPEDELVYLFSHFTVHYREGGIGCRQLIDIWVYLKNHTQLDQAYLRAQMDKLELLTFYDNVCHTIDVWFADQTSDQMSDYISSVIFGNGSWGTETQRTVAMVSKNTSLDQIKTRQQKMVFWTIFPRLDRMQQIYPVLRKAPILLPIMWVVRWFVLLLTRRKKVFGWVKSHGSVTTEKVSEFQDGLTYVGLSYKH